MPPKSNQYSQVKCHVSLFVLLLVGNVSAYTLAELEIKDSGEPCSETLFTAQDCKDYARAMNFTFRHTGLSTTGSYCQHTHYRAWDHNCHWFGEYCDFRGYSNDHAAFLAENESPAVKAVGKYATDKYPEDRTEPGYQFDHMCRSEEVLTNAHSSGLPAKSCSVVMERESVTWMIFGPYSGINHASCGQWFDNDCVCPITSSPTTAPTTAAPTATILLGDAHLFGPHGDRTDFKGRNNTYYNVLSTNNLSVAVLFMHDTYNWRNKVVFGSWMKAVAVSALTAENKLVMAAYHCERPAMMDVHTEGDEDKNGQFTLGSDFLFQEVEVSLSKDYVFAVSNGEWEVEAKNSYLPYASENEHKKRLDVNLKTIANVDMNPVAPHGLIGQAWDRDDKMVIGALDDYNTASRVVETSAMAEGAIEGSAVDYEIDHRNPFSTKFKYSRFGLKRAAPRDVSLLSGKKLFALKTTASAGAMNDEDSEA